MKERPLPPAGHAPRSSGIDDSAEDDAMPPTVTVCSGIYEHRLPLVGAAVGDVRVRLRDRLDIGPRAVAVVDGNDVGDDHVLRAGEVLTFVQRAGEKGMSAIVQISGDRVLATDRAGARTGMPVSSFVAALRHASMPSTSGTIAVPPGCRLLDQGRNCIVAVHETPPRVHSLTWIRSDSPADYGSQATFRQVRIALPYVVMLAVFQRVGDDAWALSPSAAVYFRREPVSARSDELLLPALLNCMATDGLCSQLCTQHLDPRATAPVRGEQALSRGLAAVYSHLFASGFNRHVEMTGRRSCFTMTAQLSHDARLHSIEALEAATAADRDFALAAGWLDAGRTVGQAIDVLRHLNQRQPSTFESADHIAGLVARNGEPVDQKEGAA